MPRARGSLNKKTIERQATQALALARIRQTARNKRQAIEVLDEFMQAFAAIASYHQPVPKGVAVPENREPNEPLFYRYGQLACWAAGQLAPFQSVKFRAVAVISPPSDPSPTIDQDGNTLQFPKDAQSLVKLYTQAIAQVKG